MDFVRMTILDEHRTIHGQPSIACAEQIIAALSTDPVTLEELAAGVKRFQHSDATGELFVDWASGLDDCPVDSAACVIDLAAQLIACGSSEIPCQPYGDVQPDVSSGHWVRYALSDRWLFTHAIQQWKSIAEARRADGERNLQLDFRSILFGTALLETLVHECAVARECGKDDPLGSIHARWLLAARDDLAGKSPREWLLSCRDHIDSDLQYRDQQWSMQGRCPPPLPRTSTAYRLGGCGTHEIVLYYELVRYLLAACWSRLQVGPSVNGTELIARLATLREAWLDTPQRDNLFGKSPRQVIDDERRRIPQAIPNSEALWQQHSDGSQHEARSARLVFWYLDGSQMDEDFPFSFCRTRAEWEQQQRDWAEFEGRFYKKPVAK